MLTLVLTLKKEQNSMQVNQITHSVLNEPKKWGAVLLLLLSSFLFFKECLEFFHKQTTVISEASQSTVQRKQERISLASPVFSEPVFGKFVPNLTDMEVKKSTLDVELVGILYSTDSKKSQVIIRIHEGEEKTFLVGESLPGGAVVRQINQDGILVFYNGALESLSLPQNELLFDKPLEPLIRE